jgi:hypothetical protein
MPDKNNSIKAALEALPKIDPSKLPKPVRLPDDHPLRNPLRLPEDHPLRKLARTPEQSNPQSEQPKRKHKPHKPHKQYQRERVRAVLDQIPNWHELSDDDLVALVEEALPKEKAASDKRKTILRAAGRLK